MKKNILAIFLSLMLIISTYSPVNADTQYDSEAPIIEKFAIENNKEIGETSMINVSLDILEEGSGAKELEIVFVNEQNNNVIIKYDFKKLAFTGKVDIMLDTNLYNFEIGNYKVYTISITDSNDNKRIYSLHDIESSEFTKDITVVENDGQDHAAPIIESIDIVGSNVIDVTKPIIFKVKTIEKSAIQNIEIELYPIEGNNIVVLKAKIDKILSTGEYEIEFVPIKNSISGIALYMLNSYSTEDIYGNKAHKYMNWLDGVDVKAYQFKNFNSEVEYLERISVKEKNITTPNTLEVNLMLKEKSGPIQAVLLDIKNENGYRKTLCWKSDELVYDKLLTISFPVSTYIENGKYTIVGATVYGEESNQNFDEYQLKTVIASGTYINIKSEYSIDYYGSTANTAEVVKNLKSIKDDGIAIIDYSNQSIAEKALFEAIYGTNKTIVFESKDIQWIFNGKDIIENQIKDIDLETKFQEASGKKYGIDSENVLEIIFKDNGLLPGKATIRLSHSYLKAQYGFKSDMILSYYKDMPEIIEENIDCQKDGFVQFQIEHNSTYILSDKKPRLVPPTNIKANISGKKVKLTWNKAIGNVKYKIYRSTSRNGKYSEVGTSNTNSYVDKNVQYGKVYYYRICTYGNNTDVILSNPIIAKVKPGAVNVKIKKSNKKITFIFKSRGASSYQLCFSKNGKKFAKTINLKNKNKYVIKKKSKYKILLVRAVVGKSNYSEYKTILIK